MTKQLIDINHDYMSLIYEYIINIETKKNIIDIIRDDFSKFKNTDEYKNKNLASFDWSNKYPIDHIIDNNDFFNSFGHLKIFKLLPKFAKDYCYDSYDNFIKDCGDIVVEVFLISYIIEEYIITDLK